MESYIPLICLVVVVALLWRQAMAGSPVVWTRARVGLLAAAALGAVAVPFLVAAVIRG